MGTGTFFTSIWSFLVEHFGLALTVVFIAPLQNLETLWVLIPIYLGMILADIFQEKRGTSMGNAISNAMIPFWGGIDFFRITMRTWKGGTIEIIEIIIASLIILYGALIIIVGGFLGKKIIKYIARIREVSYIIVMFVPVYYDIIELNWSFIIALVMFFPVFYFAFELILRILPDSTALMDEVKVIDKGVHHLEDEVEDFAFGHHGSDKAMPGGMKPNGFGQVGEKKGIPAKFDRYGNPVTPPGAKRPGPAMMKQNPGTMPPVINPRRLGPGMSQGIRQGMGHGGLIGQNSPAKMISRNNMQMNSMMHQKKIQKKMPWEK